MAIRTREPTLTLDEIADEISDAKNQVRYIKSQIEATQGRKNPYKWWGEAFSNLSKTLNLALEEIKMSDLYYEFPGYLKREGGANYSKDYGRQLGEKIDTLVLSLEELPLQYYCAVRRDLRSLREFLYAHAEDLGIMVTDHTLVWNSAQRRTE